jgi:capsular polysaccharide biosynthesis protein
VTQTSADIGYLPRLLRRRLWLVVTGIVLGLLGALLVLTLTSQDATATTSLNINVISEDPFSTDRSAADLLDADTETQLATSSSVLGEARNAIGSEDSVTELRSRVVAAMAPDSTVMRISYTDSDADAATAGADAVAKAYLDYRGAQAVDRVQSIVGQLDDQRDTLQDDLLRVNTIARDAAPGSVEAIQAQTSQQLITVELDSLSSRINSFLGLDTSGGSVLAPAAEGQGSEDGPNRALVILLGLLLGLLLGVLAALVASAFSRRITDADDIRRAGGGALLGELTGKKARIPASEEDTEAIRRVREVLLATLPEPRVVAVADLTTNSPVTDVAVNLAHVMAETGRGAQLVLAEGDPKTVRLIAEGLLLSPSTDNTNEVRRFSGADGMTLVAGNGRRPLPLESAVGSTSSRDVSGLPVTVVAVPEEPSHSALMAAGRNGHAVVLVVAKGSSAKATVARAAQDLAVVGSRVHGTVLVPKGRRPALGTLTGEAPYTPRRAAEHAH